MFHKPMTCVGCPFYGDGEGYVPDTDNGSTVTFWGQNPGENEEKGLKFEGWSGGLERWASHSPAPLIGKTGHLLKEKFVPLATGREPNFGNVIRCRFRHTNTLPKLREASVRGAIFHCRVHDNLSSHTTHHVALGEYAAFALGGLHGKDIINKWRGWVVPMGTGPQPTHVWTPVPPMVYVTYHPAVIFRDRSLQPIVQHDFQKLSRLIDGSWPLPFPHLHRGHPVDPTRMTAYDTEFDPKSKRFRMYSWAQANGNSLSVGISFEPPPKLAYPVGHNLAVDWIYLPSPPARWEDTMMEHAALYGGFPHDLNFLGSLFARTNRWKHLWQINEEEYSAGDALGTLDSHLALQAQLSSHDRERWIYEHTQRPLVPILVNQKPLRLHTGRIKSSLEEMARLMGAEELKAQASVGWPLKLGSPKQVGMALREKR